MNPPLLPDWQRIRDEEQLNLLAIFHYVVGGLNCLMVVFFIFQLLVMIGVTAIPVFSGHRDAVLPVMVMIPLFLLIFGFLTLLWLGLGIATIYSGRCIRARRNRIFTLVVAGVNCMMFPFGTALGVFTFIVLSRESVRQVYGP